MPTPATRLPRRLPAGRVTVRTANSTYELAAAAGVPADEARYAPAQGTRAYRPGRHPRRFLRTDSRVLAASLRGVWLPVTWAALGADGCLRATFSPEDVARSGRVIPDQVRTSPVARVERHASTAR